MIVLSIKTYNKGKANQLTTHFNSYEFDCNGKGCCNTTHIDSQLVEYLEQIRKHFNKPVFINSAYRCKTHNNKVGGSSNSQHLKGSAADIVVSGVSPEEVAKYAESIGVKGIGLYNTAADGYFVHIDTRNYKSFWKGHKQAYISTFNGATANKNLATTPQTLYFGKKNSDVKLLQERLIVLGYDLGVYGADGHYGTKTYIAVRQFQKDNGLATDGICGAKTWTALLE
jgi:hypothetical protein